LNEATVFIVDDNPNNLALLAGILREAGYQVRAANDGVQALAAIAARTPDLVMLDIQMPGLDGYEVCRQLKAAPATRDIPVLFISALSDALDKVRAFDLGGVDYVTKPFEVQEVIARVGHQIRILRFRRDLERRNAELQRINAELLREQQRTARVFSALSDALPGTMLDGKFRLEAKIGEGGFGAVYRATHLALNRLVAVKVLRPSTGNDTPEAIERFRAEGISAGRLDHPNAVSVLDFGVSSAGTPYLVMELLHGETLRSEMKRRGTLPVRRCAEIILPVCAVLAEAHALGIVHRDIKPSNVFVHQSRGAEVVKVVDFGIAKLFGDGSAGLFEEETLTAGFVGTLEYMSPERVENSSYDGRSDVYSVGVMLYEMLCGRVPFQRTGGSPYAVALMHVRREVPPLREINPTVPEEVERVVLLALRKAPAERPTAAAFARQLALASENT
jgi:DNA-binding response OmpR family regulator